MELDYSNASTGEAFEPGWELVGFVINAFKDVGWINRFFSALERGEITARSECLPPRTRSDALNSTPALSPEWWLQYKALMNIDYRTVEWEEWWHDHLFVNLAQTYEVLIEYLDAMRAQFRNNKRPGISRSTWSDLEALAWYATGDIEFVHKMRDFSHQARNSNVAHTVGTFYLKFKFALSYCSCGARRPLSLPNEAGACSCIILAAEQLVESLLSGDLRATIVPQDGFPEPVNPPAFTNAKLNLEHERFELLGGPAELQFEERQVYAATAHHRGQTEHPTAPAPSTKADKAKGGRPKGSGGRNDKPHLQRMAKLLKSNTVKTVREAAKMVESDANKDPTVEVESAIRRLTRKFNQRTKMYIN